MYANISYTLFSNLIKIKTLQPKNSVYSSYFLLIVNTVCPKSLEAPQ
jgi:hypothetical protein